MRRFLLADAQPGDLLDDVYLLTGKQLSTTTTGKYFIKAFVGDRSQQVTARMWNATREAFNQMPDNGFVYLRGRVENYQSNLQIIIDGWQIAEEGSYDLADLMPTTTKNVPAMFARLVELIESLRNRAVYAVAKAFIDDEQLMADLRRAPAAMTFHHAYIGGLLEHTLNAMEVANAVLPFYPKLNRDLVLAGIFLHDLAKTWELKYETAFGYTDGGHLVGHIVKIVLWLEEKLPAAAAHNGGPVPRDVVDVLSHILLSHHGEPEFGAAKVPATPEAIAVHTLENLDAKMMMSLGVTRPDDEASATGRWTEYQKAFGGKLFKPDVAPPDRDRPSGADQSGVADQSSVGEPTRVADQSRVESQESRVWDGRSPAADQPRAATQPRGEGRASGGGEGPSSAQGGTSKVGASTGGALKGGASTGGASKGGVGPSGAGDPARDTGAKRGGDRPEAPKAPPQLSNPLFESA